MAAVHAGTKRSHHDMTNLSATPTRSRLNTAGEEQSPSGTRASTPGRPSDVTNGSYRQRYSFPPRKQPFPPSTSIALIGVRGVGKSTLGVLAATAYNRRLIDTERAFYEATGAHPSAYRKAQGAEKYQQKHSDVLRRLLNNHGQGAVIVCTFSDLEGDGTELLRNFAQSHPVIHITRDVPGIHGYLKVWDIDRVRELLHASSTRLRTCTNYEYLNLSEQLHGSSTPHEKNYQSPSSFLTLKRVERDFLRLLQNILGDQQRTSAHHSAYPFSQVSLKERRCTLSVNIRMTEVLSGGTNFDQLQVGADCITLLVEADGPIESKFNDIALAFSTLRRMSILPIMLHIKNTAAETRSPSTRMHDFTEFCLRLCPDLCTFDMPMTDSELKYLLQAKGACISVATIKRQTHDAAPIIWLDAALLDEYRRSAKLGCDFCIVTLPSQDVEDVFAINDFRRSVDRLKLPTRLIAYATGSKGQMSRCFNPSLTAVNPPLPDNDNTIQPQAHSLGTAKDLVEAYFATGILEPLTFYLFGADVSYSVSPAMHNTAYGECGLRYVYEARSSANLEELREVFHRRDLGGVAVAQPYKTMIVSSLDGLSPHARAIGAVNTIVPIREMDKNGSIPEDHIIIARRPQRGTVKALYGFNTDWIGIRGCVRHGLSPANAVRAASSALICGAGGMARSALYALLSLGVKNIFVYNRTLASASTLVDRYNNLVKTGGIPELAEDCADQVRISVLESLDSPWPEDVRQPTIIVSGIPTQEPGHTPANFSVPDAWLKSPTGGVVLELAYRHPESPLADQIRARAQHGWIFLNGYDMLPEQAFAQFELFTGRRAPRSVMRNEITKRRPAHEVAR